ncbi:aryl-alcohol-oxidase from pleurotus Eryingii [Guyanagaster necrorhizus]|uniref:Aryl-alcohol-oxidase from pleurotus Eryingii n=1 Tax=Guyanagaster necrorhizus TaxID=856835 RepID=A0A9P8ALS1_9AGAR|nr:aryl-alcohol-oxidase from pleurotus Eryingii [Guyanagaster necrorhizus MCA 3950]KAG7440523.1 aryl-alcohol-oxidase from pleurotus Eryingii [Guyanagaster necrorhizus MCA 3950]
MQRYKNVFSETQACKISDMLLLLSLVFLSLAGTALADIYNNVDELPRNLTFDFIVIGGGTAGNVVANRLTENPSFSVLVLEAGPSPEGQLNHTVPFFSIFLREQSPLDWNYTTVPQVGLDGSALQYPRGRILGGCSSMNRLAYVRGSSEDYDRYANVTGDNGWSWNEIQPYIRKNERWTSPTDNHNTSGQFNPAVHGFHGINSVSLAGFPSPTVQDRVIQVTEELSDEFPFNLDYNSGFQLGVGWAQSTIKHGKRSSSFTSYLGPEFVGRQNLHILLNAQVTRLLQTNSDPTEFLTVEFAENKDAPRQRVTATKEVIISTGSVGTPTLLLNSGIGDPNQLSRFGIKTLINIPDVGKNLSNQPMLTLSYFVNSTNTFDDIIRNLTLRSELIRQWIETDGDGPLGIGPYGTHQVFTRLSKNSTALETNPDPAAGPNTAHIQSGIQNGDISPPPEGHFMTISLSLNTPTSRGSIQLNTTDAFDQPLIDLGLLTTDFDVLALKEGIGIAQRFVGARAWDGYVLGPLSNITASSTDAELEAFIRANTSPNGHIVSTASMSPKGAQHGVVDPDLRVKGIARLRVVDASILPFVPSANTQFAVYMVGERGADLIKAAW